MNMLIKQIFLNKLNPILKHTYSKLPVFKLQSIQSNYFSTLEKEKIKYIGNVIDIEHYENILNVNKYTNRTHTCGELCCKHLGKQVILYGWMEYQRMNKFIVLRDSYGETQILISENDENTQKKIQEISYESILKITGTVVSRPKNMINKQQKTGEIEVQVENLEIINRANDNLPFNIRDYQKAKENLRMQYRYLDLRFKQMQRNLRVRSMLLMKMREFLINNNFIDIETPTLFKATPGGAQEFIVPTRFAGKFYSLVQSPQQFKQMLMAGAIDRYFQIAKCYRDESIRSDRQPEFTQLDIELSFTNLNGVLELIENLLFYILNDLYGNIRKKIPRITYEEAMENYGSDKPDISFDFKLENCTDLLKKNKKINILQSLHFAAYILIFDSKHLSNPSLTKSVKDKINAIASCFPKAKLIQCKITDDDDWTQKMEKFLTKEESNKLLEKFNIEPESVVFLAYGSKNDTRSLLGKIRLEYVNILETKSNMELKVRKSGLHFLWVVDFPLFEFDEETGKLQSAHHPFTSPHPDDIKLLEQHPENVRALAYDLVLNGNEIGGGSIRIHDPILQETILDLLQIDKNTLQHIIDMLGSGCPPHGGIALGLDRFLAILLNLPSIRDTIAFPKNFEGKDPMGRAPSEISEDVLKMYHINTIKN